MQLRASTWCLLIGGLLLVHRTTVIFTAVDVKAHLVQFLALSSINTIRIYTGV